MVLDCLTDAAWRHVHILELQLRRAGSVPPRIFIFLNMHARPFQSHFDRSSPVPMVPTSPNKLLRSRTARMASEQLPPPAFSRPLPTPPSFPTPPSRSTTPNNWPSTTATPPSSPEPARKNWRDPRTWKRRSSTRSAETPSEPPPPYTTPSAGPEPRLALEILSHPRLPLLLLFPLALILTYTILVAVDGWMKAQHLALERPWTAFARILEARARQAKWNMVTTIAQLFSNGEQAKSGALAQVGRWIGAF